MWAKAATGSLKNPTPKRLIATSKVSASNEYTWASPCTNVAFVRPSSPAPLAGLFDQPGGPMRTWRSSGRSRPATRCSSAAASEVATAAP